MKWTGVVRQAQGCTFDCFAREAWTVLIHLNQCFRETGLGFTRLLYMLSKWLSGPNTRPTRHLLSANSDQSACYMDWARCQNHNQTTPSNSCTVYGWLWQHFFILQSNKKPVHAAMTPLSIGQRLGMSGVCVCVRAYTREGLEVALLLTTTWHWPHTL